MKLLFLTHWFPFSPGEEFIRHEISILSKHFDCIDLFPVFGRSRNAHSGVPIPKNVRVRLDWLDAFESSKKSVKRFLKIPLSAKGWILREGFFRGNPAFQLQEARYVYASFILAQMLAEWADSNEKKTAYSYWMRMSSTTLAFLRRLRSDFTVISRAHSGDLYASQTENIEYRFQRLSIEELKAIFACSAHGQKYLQNKYPDFSEKIECSRLGVPVPQTSARPSSDGKLRLLSCSGLDAVKRIHLIIEALNKVKRKVEWHHIGNGPLRLQLEKLASHLPPHITTVFHGFMSFEKMGQFYRDQPVDFFINVSSREGIPVTIMEAMSYGIPSLATNVGGTSEIVNEKNGFLLDPDFTSMELAHILDELTLESDKRGAAQETQIKDFNAEINFSTFANRIQQLAR